MNIKDWYPFLANNCVKHRQEKERILFYDDRDVEVGTLYVGNHFYYVGAERVVGDAIEEKDLLNKLNEFDWLILSRILPQYRYRQVRKDRLSGTYSVQYSNIAYGEVVNLNPLMIYFSQDGMIESIQGPDERIAYPPLVESIDAQQEIERWLKQLGPIQLFYKEGTPYYDIEGAVAEADDQIERNILPIESEAAKEAHRTVQSIQQGNWLLVHIDDVYEEDTYYFARRISENGYTYEEASVTIDRKTNVATAFRMPAPLYEEVEEVAEKSKKQIEDALRHHIRLGVQWDMKEDEIIPYAHIVYPEALDANTLQPVRDHEIIEERRVDYDRFTSFVGAREHVSLTFDKRQGIFTVDGQQVGQYEFDPEERTASYTFTFNERVDEGMTDVLLFEYGKVALKMLGFSMDTHRFSGMELDDTYWVTAFLVDDETGKELIQTGATAILTKGGQLLSISITDRPYVIRSLALDRSLEQIKEDYLKRLTFPLRIAYIDEEYGVTKPSYQLVYDVIQSPFYVEVDGTICGEEERVEDEKTMAYPSFERQIQTFLKEKWNISSYRLVQQWEEEEEVTFFVERLYEGIPVSHSLITPTSFVFDKATERLVRASFDPCLYVSPDQFPHHVDPIYTEEDAYEIVAQHIDFALAPSFEETIQIGHQFVDVYVRGVVEQFPFGSGAIHYVHATTCIPYVINTDFIIEEGKGAEYI